MTVFTHLRRHRRRIARVLLATFVTTWAALAWQPCVHAYDGMQEKAPSAQEADHCLHCPPKVSAEVPSHDCCDEGAVKAPCTDMDQSSADGRPAVKLLLPAALPVYLPQAYFPVDVRSAVVLPVQGDAWRRAPRRPINLTFGVLLN